MYLVVKLMSLPCLRHYNDVNTLLDGNMYSGIKENAMIKIKVWKSNGMQEN